MTSRQFGSWKQVLHDQNGWCTVFLYMSIYAISGLAIYISRYTSISPSYLGIQSRLIDVYSPDSAMPLKLRQQAQQLFVGREGRFIIALFVLEIQ